MCVYLCVYIYIYIYMYIYISLSLSLYIYIYICIDIYLLEFWPLWSPDCHGRRTARWDAMRQRCLGFRRGKIRLETPIELRLLNSSFSRSNFKVRVVRAYPLVETRQTVPCRAIGGNSFSVKSTLPSPLNIAAAMKLDSGKSRHFCDDPICPDPIWKLPVHKSRLWILTVLTQAWYQV